MVWNMKSFLLPWQYLTTFTKCHIQFSLAQWLNATPYRESFTSMCIYISNVYIKSEFICWMLKELCGYIKFFFSLLCVHVDLRPFHMLVQCALQRKLIIYGNKFTKQICVIGFAEWERKTEGRWQANKQKNGQETRNNCRANWRHIDYIKQNSFFLLSSELFGF